MAGKRLVMAPSPGTGLFAHEPRPREKGRYAREPPKETDKPLVDHEEERVNKQLVEILERKVAKLRGRADEEERGRKAAEAQLEDFKQRLEIREHEMAVLSAAKRDLEEDRHEAVRRRAELEGVQQDCASVQRALREREAEVQRLEDKRLHDEEQWKAQILKLLGEVKKVEQTSASLSQELTATKSELSRVKAGGQDVVRRYEEESGRRLELEERCLQLEEKVRAGSAKSRDAEFQQKLKQSQQAKQTVEELAKHHEERGREEALRADEAEARCQDLQMEVQRLHALCCEQKQRIRELEASPAAPAAAPQEVPEEEGPPAASQLPPLPGRSSRPGTGGSAASAASERSRGPGNRSRSATESLPQPLAGGYQKAGASEGRLPPGAIRRGGSVPVRKPGAGRGIPHPLAKQSRSASPGCQVQRTPPPFGAGILRVANSDSRPNSAASRQGSSQRAESEADLGIDDAIPSESDSSDEEEVLTAVKSSA